MSTDWFPLLNSSQLEMQVEELDINHLSPWTWNLLKLLELEAVQNESILHDNWHPKILTNVIKSVYMRQQLQSKDFDVFFLTNPNGKESVKRSSTYLDGYGHFIARYDEGSDRDMYKTHAKDKIALVFLKVRPTSLDSQVWVPMIYLPELDQQYRGGF